MTEPQVTSETHVLFQLGDTGYSIRSQFVQQMEMVEHVTPVPNAPPFVEGVVLSRGAAWLHIGVIITGVMVSGLLIAALGFADSFWVSANRGTAGDCRLGRSDRNTSWVSPLLWTSFAASGFPLPAAEAVAPTPSIAWANLTTSA